MYCNQKIKYVLGLQQDDGIDSRRLEAIIFGDSLAHKEVGNTMFGFSDRIVGAGFVEFAEDGKAYATGESESLGIRANVEFDTPYIQMALGQIPRPNKQKEKDDFYAADDLIQQRNDKAPRRSRR